MFICVLVEWIIGISVLTSHKGCQQKLLHHVTEGMDGAMISALWLNVEPIPHYYSHQLMDHGSC